MIPCQGLFPEISSLITILFTLFMKGLECSGGANLRLNYIDNAKEST
jgi:hypothetical protein